MQTESPEMRLETVWRCRNVSVSTWRLQTCSPGTEAVLPLFLHYHSLCLSSLLPFHLLVYFLLLSPACPTLICSIFSPLNYSQHCFPLVSFPFLLSEQTDSSWLLQQQRKFSHVFLIKVPHRSPTGRFSCNITTQSIVFSLR